MNQSAPSDTSDAKRRKLHLQVSIEAGADGRVPVHQVFPDGSFIPAVDSHFERTSAAASAFVARALAAPVPAASASIETKATDEADPPKWAARAVTSIEGALYELGRSIAVVEALRATEPLLELKRTQARAKPKASSSGISPSIARDGPAMLMAKRRAMSKSATVLAHHATALEKWVEADNAFCEALLTLRKRCNGIRRTPAGVPLIDVGDGEFTPIHRPHDIAPHDPPPDLSATDDKLAKELVHLNFPPATYLRFGVTSLTDDYRVATAPVVVESGLNAEEQSLRAIIRRIRLSRVSAFRRQTFERIAKEAGPMPILIELTTNTLGIESGPRDIVRMEKTKRAGCSPSVEAGIDPTLPPVLNMVELQNASLLQIISIHACLTQNVKGDGKAAKILDRVLAATSIRSVLQATENVIDDAVHTLRVRAEWTRGLSFAEEVRVRVFSSASDGDGPERALATIEPISNINNAGNVPNNGHVRITPAFGVIIPAPDDPGARGRAVAPHSSSSSGPSATVGLDDVPRSYTCPVGGEVISLLTLLLCIRLLDALETAARSGEEDMLDVDRQCFTVIVSSPRSGDTAKAKVWPKGPAVGEEVPGATAWLNGQKVQDFPVVGPGRVEAWKKLLRRLVKKEDAVDGDMKMVEVEELDSKGTRQEGVASDVEMMNRVAGVEADATAVNQNANETTPFPFDQQQADDANQFRFDL